MPLYQDETATLSTRDRTVQPPDLLARSGIPVPQWIAEPQHPQFNADIRRMCARISSLFAMIAPTAQGEPEAAQSLALVAHAPQHEAGGGDEIDLLALSVAGLTPGQVMRATGASSYSFGWLTVTDLPLAARMRTIEFTGADVPSLVLSDHYTRVPYACEIVRWTLMGDAVGNLQLDLFRSAFPGFPPTVSLVGAGNKPALVAQQGASGVPTGWNSTALVAGDVVAAHYDSGAGLNKATLVLDVLIT